MTNLWKAVSGAALVATIGPPLAYAAGAMTLDAMKVAMTLATVAWFIATPFWMKAE